MRVSKVLEVLGKSVVVAAVATLLFSEGVYRSLADSVVNPPVADPLAVTTTILASWTGTANITTLGTINTGTWNATAISVAKGGTGSANATAARTALGIDPYTTKIERIAPDTITPVTTGSNITINATTTAIAAYTINASITLNDPTGGVDGNTVKVWLTASGGNRTVAFSALVPSSATLSSPITVESGKTNLLLLEKVQGSWCITSHISGYTLP